VEKDCRARGLNREDAMDRARWRKLIGMIDDCDESSGWMFLIVPAHPGFPGQIPQSRKTVVCVCVCVCSVLFAALLQESCEVLWWVCLSVCLHNSKTTQSNFTKFLCMFHRLSPPLMALWYVVYFRFVDDVIFSHNCPVTRRVYSWVVIEHNKHNRWDSNQILLSDEDQKYSLWFMHWGNVCDLWLPCC